MTRIALRLSLLSMAVVVFPGCLELALIQALQKDDEEVYYDESYDYDEESYDEESYDETETDTWDDWETDVEEEPYYEANALDIRSASLAGDMGDVRDFWDDEPMYSGYDYGTYTSMEIHASAATGAAMTILDFQGGIRHADLTPGAHFEFSNFEAPEDGLYMYVIGCAGPSEGNWYFDEQAEDVIIDVSATPEGSTVLDFTATFSDGQTVVGSAEIGALQAQ